MSTAELAQQIAALPALSRAQVERLVVDLSHVVEPNTNPVDLAARAQAIQDRIFKKHGSLGSVAEDVRRLRENGR